MGMITDNQYIEHEIEIRVLKETTNSKFTMMQKNIDDRFAHIDYKINILIGIAVASFLIPLLKSALGYL